MPEHETGKMFSLGCMVLVAIAATSRADWTNFRGPNHDGISDEKGFRTRWTGPIPLLWQKKVGSAFSSFACLGDRVYTCGTQDKKQVLLCLNADTGDVIWQTAIEKEYNDSHGEGTRATPTLNDGRVYIQGPHGTLLCLRADDGRILWKKTFHEPPQWGYSGSVLVEGNLAIATGGGSAGSLVAFDKATGEQVWKCGDDPVGYATPYPFTFENKRYIVGFTGTSAIIADAKTGRRVCRQPWKTDWNINAASPIYHEGYLFLSSGYRTGSGLFKIRSDGADLAMELVWKSKVLMNKFQSCILYQGNLYGSDQKALVCADFLTGKERWRKHHLKHGTVVLADGHLLLLTQEGQLQIAEVSPQHFEPITRADILDGRCWSVPVLHHGRLYARNLDRLVCFNLNR